MWKYCFLLLVCGNLWAEQRIEILSQVEAKAGSLLLKDIAVVEGFSLGAQEALENTEIESNLKQGELRKYSDSALTDILRRKLNQIKSLEAANGKEFNLVLKMPKLLEVYVSSPLWTKKQIQKILIESNRKHCGECEFQVLSLSLPEVAEKKIAKWQMEPVTRMLNGNFQVPVKLYTLDRKEPLTYWILGKMASYRLLPVARRNLMASDRLVEEDVVWEKREWNFSRRDIPEKKDLKNTKVKRMLMAGSVVWLSNLERPLAVQSGDLVDLIIRKENWEIRMKAVAQNQGMVGDMVSVKSRETQKLLNTKVVAKGEVELR